MGRQARLRGPPYAEPIGHDPRAAKPRRRTHPALTGPDDRRLDVAAQTFALLADPTRLQIVWHLRDGERSVNEIAQLVGKAPATVSQHLGKLRLAHLLEARRDGNFIYYCLADNHVGEVVEDALFHAEHLGANRSGARRR